MIVAVGMVRDEADIITACVLNLLEQCDLVVVADNLSADGTRERLDSIGSSRLLVVDDPIVAYEQSTKMTNLANTYASYGDWVVPFDADEIWHNVKQLPDVDADVVIAPVRRYIPTLNDPPATHPIVRMQHFVPGYDGATKVAFRWQAGVVIGQGNHNVTGAGPRVRRGPVTIDHYQYRTREQVARKVRQGAAAYETAAQAADQGVHWKELAALTDTELDAWWHDYCTQPVVRSEEWTGT